MGEMKMNRFKAKGPLYKHLGHFAESKWLDQGHNDVGGPTGLEEDGNIDLNTRPRVKNADGTTSTVRSIGANIDGKETLIPTVSDDGRIMSDTEAVDTARRTGKHLGKYRDIPSANVAGQRLHASEAEKLK